MVFPVVGGDGKPTGYDISNSLRFNSGDTARLTNDPGGGSGSDGSRTQFSISMWVKRSTLGLGDNSKQQALISASATNNFYGGIKFNGDDKIQINLVNSGSDQDEVVTDAIFRDVSSWYHLFFVFDKTQASLSNGIKLYVNGALQTFGTTTYAQNQGYHFSRPGKTTAVGVQQVDTSSPFDGYMAEIHFADGQLKAHTDFGETDDNGVWIPKEYTGSYGTYGFYLEFKQTGTSENSSGIGADTSGNDEHFAVTNLAAIDVTTDTPTNNFCTMNPLDVGANLSNTVFSEGNCKLVKSGTTSNNGDQVVSTMGFAGGKWYWEIKGVSNPENMFWTVFNDVLGGIAPYHNNYAYSMYGDGNGSNSQIYESQEGAQKGYGIDNGTCFSDNDIIQMAFDADNYRLYIGRNGSWVDDNAASGGTITSGSGFNESSPTGYYQISTAAAQAGFYRFAVVIAGSSVAHTTEINFGNPSFSISSGNSDANGYGNFEYAVPSGYYSINTKNLAEFG